MLPRRKRRASAARSGGSERVETGRQAQPQIERPAVDALQLPDPGDAVAPRPRPGQSRSCWRRPRRRAPCCQRSRRLIAAAVPALRADQRARRGSVRLARRRGPSTAAELRRRIGRRHRRARAGDTGRRCGCARRASWRRRGRRAVGDEIEIVGRRRPHRGAQRRHPGIGDRPRRQPFDDIGVVGRVDREIGVGQRAVELGARRRRSARRSRSGRPAAACRAAAG